MISKHNQQQQQADSPNQARELIRRHGDDRAKLLEAARNFKAEG
jgi:hypothetical protein